MDTRKERDVAAKKKPGAKKSGLKLRDLKPREDSKGGAASPAKSSPVSLEIPPRGFIANSDHPNGE
jgi:hypothetical protein